MLLRRIFEEKASESKPKNVAEFVENQIKSYEETFRKVNDAIFLNSEFYFIKMFEDKMRKIYLEKPESGFFENFSIKLSKEYKIDLDKCIFPNKKV